MIDTSKIDVNKDVYCFELDDVLFPKKDYLLQVYYLFSSFVEFMEGRAVAQDMIAFMKETLLVEGGNQVFPSTQQRFGFDCNFEDNFNRLQANAQLPLKLLLFENIEDFMVSLLEKGKKIAILTEGNPVEQLNKIKHIEWGRADAFKIGVKVFFKDELIFKGIDPLSYIMEIYNVSKEKVHVIDREKTKA